MKEIKKSSKSDGFTTFVNEIEDKFLQIFDTFDNIDLIIDKIVNSVIELDKPKIIIDHYLILQRLKDDYTANYSNGFFNRLFLQFYLKFPRTLIALFIESSNYQFLYHFLGYIQESINKSTNIETKQSMYRLYNLIILLFSIQLNKDFTIIKNNKICSCCNFPIISNVAIYAPSNKDINDKTERMIRKHISYKLFGNSTNSTIKYDNIVEILRFNIEFFTQNKFSKYTFENDMDDNIAKKCCFKLFYKNFTLDIKEYTKK